MFLFTAEELDQLAFKGPFQLKRFYGSTVLRFITSVSCYATQKCGQVANLFIVPLKDWVILVLIQMDFPWAYMYPYAAVCLHGT